MAKRQDESEISRKKLVELSRDFKKTSSEVCKVTPFHDGPHITNCTLLGGET